VVLLQNDVEVRLVGQKIPGTNMLGLIVWAFIVGIMLVMTGEKGKTVVELLIVINETTKVTVNWILW